MALAAWITPPAVTMETSRRGLNRSPAKVCCQSAMGPPLRCGKAGYQLLVERVEGAVGRKTEGHVFRKQPAVAQPIEIVRRDARPGEEPRQDQVEDRGPREHPTRRDAEDRCIGEVREPDGTAGVRRSALFFHPRAQPLERDQRRV